MTLLVGFVGFGRFAQAMSGLLLDAEIPFYFFDPASLPNNSYLLSRQRADLGELCQQCNWIVLALPVNRMAKALEQLRPHLTKQHLVLDVGSVKVNPERMMSQYCGETIPWVATHPLFGPTSLALAERPLQVIVCPNPGFPTQVDQVCAFYRQLGCEPVLQTAVEHDHNMAESHALAFFVAKGMLEAGINLDNPHAPPSFQAIARTAFVVRSDAGHLFSTITHENPFAAQARQKFVEALQRIEQQIQQSDSESDSSPFEIAGLGASAPVNRSAEELISELDAEIDQLLQRRKALVLRLKKNDSA